jgi:hypothetical protein
MGDAREAPEKLAYELLDLSLDHFRRLLDGCVLGLERGVAASSGHEPAVGCCCQ